MTQTLVMLEGNLDEIEQWAEANPLQRFTGDCPSKPFSIKEDHEGGSNCYLCLLDDPKFEEDWNYYFSRQKRFFKGEEQEFNNPIRLDDGTWIN